MTNSFLTYCYCFYFTSNENLRFYFYCENFISGSGKVILRIKKDYSLSSSGITCDMAKKPSVLPPELSSFLNPNPRSLSSLINWQYIMSPVKERKEENK